MQSIAYLAKTLSHLGGLLKATASIQGKTRKELRASLEELANNFEIGCKEIFYFTNLVSESSDSPLETLVIVKNGCYMHGDTFDSSDKANKIERVRRRLYGGEALILIDRFRSALDPLRYSVEITTLGETQKHLRTMQDFDYRAFDEFEIFLGEVRIAAKENNPKRIKQACIDCEILISGIAAEFRKVSRGVEI